MDSSDAALQAARVAGDLARAVETREVQILIAQERVAESIAQNSLNAGFDKTQDILQKAEDAVGRVQAHVYSELVEGQMTETVLNTAKTRRSDLIIMGAEGMGRLTGALLGINGQRIVSESPCPVLIVK